MKYYQRGLLLGILLFAGSCNKAEEEMESFVNPENPATPPQTEEINYDLAADSVVSTLVRRFWFAGENRFYYSFPGNQYYEAFTYWHQAHGLDVLVDAYSRHQNTYYKQYIDKWYDGVRAKNEKDRDHGGQNNQGFQNDYVDDMEWIALAMLRAFDVTGDDRFLNGAKNLWYQHIRTQWNDQYARGGIAWKRELPHYKNACSNGPACILACRMYKHFGDESDREMAVRIFNWMSIELYSPEGGIADCIITENGVERKEGGTTTYNQGTFIGSAVELYKITKEKKYLTYAKNAAEFTLLHHVLPGTQIIEGSSAKGEFGCFSGIFIRYFAQLIMTDDLDALSRKKYADLLDFNAEMAWMQGVDKRYMLFSDDWRKPPVGIQAYMSDHLSGCMLLEAKYATDSYMGTKN